MTENTSRTMVDAAMVRVQFVRTHEYAVIPTYATPQSAGFDLYAVEEAHLQPFQSQTINLGLKVQFPDDCVMFIMSRSSMGRNGVSLPHGVGVVDADYRGELCVPLVLSSDNPIDVYSIGIGDRVAQGIVMRIPQVEIEEVEEDALTQTSRGTGGFGSTGR